MIANYLHTFFFGGGEGSGEEKHKFTVLNMQLMHIINILYCRMQRYAYMTVHF